MVRKPLMEVHEVQGRWPQRQVAPEEQVRPHKWQFHMIMWVCWLGCWLLLWFDPEFGLDLERCW
jgi:hypothetical protein